MRKILILLLLLILGIGLDYVTSAPKTISSYCAFCDSKVLENQKFYEDDTVLALYTHKPILSGHVLVIPKMHHEVFHELTDQEIQSIGQTIKKVNIAVEKVFGTKSYLLLQKNGAESGQTVPHVHFHYIPKMEGDRSALKFVGNMIRSIVMPPIATAEIRNHAEALKMAMEDSI